MKRTISALLLGLTVLALGPAEEAFAQRSRGSSGGARSSARSSSGRSSSGSIGRSSAGRSSSSIGRSSASRSSSSTIGRSSASQSGRSSSRSSIGRSVSPAPTPRITGSGSTSRYAPTPSRTTPGSTSSPTLTPRTRYTDPRSTDPGTGSSLRSTGASSSATRPGTRTDINTYTRRALTNTGEATRSPVTGSSDSARTPTAGSRTSGAAPETSNPGTTDTVDLTSPRSSGRVRFPAPYRPAGAGSRSSSGIDRTPSSGSSRGGLHSTQRTPSSTSSRSIDAYRGRTAPTGDSNRSTSSGTGSRSSLSGTGNLRSTGSTSAARGSDSAKTVRYGSGPVRRLAEPRAAGQPGSVSSTGGNANRVNPNRGNPNRGSASGGKTTKTRATDSEVGQANARVRRNLEGARKLDETRPGTSKQLYAAGETLGRVQENALRASVGSVGGIYRSPYRGGNKGTSAGGGGDIYRSPYRGSGNGYHGGGYDYDDGYGCYNGPYYYPWGFSYYGGNWGFSIGFGSYYYPCSSYWWPYYVSCWYPYYYYGYRPYYYANAYPAYYTSVVYETVYPDQAASYEEPIVEAPVTPAVVPNSLSVAADRYLTLGDRAFREGRYTDAVQFYAKAVEYAPGEGAIYLVLADALFAAGDYHYGAYSVRRAFDLDPSLAQSVVDKHEFYPTPAEFDRQLAQLEIYLEEHPSDRDARLVLALNYLFGARPAAAVDLLSSSESAGLSGDPAATLILGSARAIQFGAQAAPEPAQPAGEK